MSDELKSFLKLNRLIRLISYAILREAKPKIGPRENYDRAIKPILL